MQRHLVLVTEPPRCYGPERQLLSVGFFEKVIAGAFRRRFCFGGLVQALVCFSHIFGVLRLSMCAALDVTPFSSSARMSSRFHRIIRAAAMAAMLALGSQAFAQSEDVDPKCGFSSLRTSCASSPARMRSCNTATGSSKSA
jgi:hypothetical protein